VVVKPLDFIARARRGLVSRRSVSRPEYLRIIYGPEYSAVTLGTAAGTRAVGEAVPRPTVEFALGVEALERFTREEPLYRVHECVFGVLALESEPVDPRL